MNKTYISLTTFSGRLEIVRYTLESLLRQEVKADKIFLNISKNPYLIDKGITQYPKWLIELVDDNKVEIKIVENIGPYRKLIPIINELKNEDNIVICDDDVINKKNWLKILVEKSAKFPSDIVCMHSRKIKRLFNGFITSSYLYWPIFYGRDYQINILPIGVGGVLYKPKFFDLNFLQNREFLRIAPVNDDLWFWFSINQKGRMVTSIKPNNDGYFFPIKTLDNLTDINYSTSSRVKSLIIKKLIKIMGWFGVPALKNDYAWLSIKKFKNQKNLNEK